MAHIVAAAEQVGVIADLNYKEGLELGKLG